MNYTRNSFRNFLILFLFLAGIIYICSRSRTDHTVFSSFQYKLILNEPNSSKKPVVQALKSELEEALENASMTDADYNKTVIIAVVNKAYVERQDESLFPTMIDLFLESFWVGEGTRSLLNNLLIVAVDQTAYDRCMFRRLNCHKLVTNGVDFAGEKLYMSDDFINMMWKRTQFLFEILKLGYSFIFTDIDVMWLRNPLPRLRSLSNNTNGSGGDEDIRISTDVFNGDPWSSKNLINTGFYHVQSNNKTISLFKVWYLLRHKMKGVKEQDVLAGLLQRALIRRLKLRVRFLDTVYFSGFCKDSDDIRVVATVHANCCRSISAKVADLSAVLHDWKLFKASNVTGDAVANGGRRFQWSSHIACINSWSDQSNRT